MSLHLGVDLRGTDVRARRDIEEAGDAVREAWKVAHFRLAEDIIDAALRDVPVRTGRLKRSRFVERRHPVPFGFSAEYAYTVHELHRGRGKKYLQHAISTAHGTAQRTLAAHFRRALATGETLASISGRHPSRPVEGGAR